MFNLKIDNEKNDLFPAWNHCAPRRKRNFVRHFVDAGYARSGIYNILALLDNNQSIERKPGSGRVVGRSEPGFQEAPKNAKEEDRGKSDVATACAAACAWSGLAMNGEIYSAKCLPEVASFIKKYHKGEDAVFWPDLASAH